MEDGKIVDLYLERNESAIKETAEKYGSKLKKLSNSIVKDLETAKECENDTYLKAWNSIPPNEPKTYFYEYLARITRNLSLNFCRSKNALKRSAYICELSKEMEECLPSVDDTQCKIDDKALSDILNSFLKSLKEEKRNIFIKRYWYLNSVSEISKNMNISESKIKTTLCRTREELKSYLIKEGYTL
ncbi:MAG: RNA polymerase sigma factor [Acutalibacteraceae bacterium]